MIDIELKSAIDNMTYFELLNKWRFDKSGDKFFQGEVGAYYRKVLFEKKDAIGTENAVKISKAVGLDG